MGMARCEECGVSGKELTTLAVRFPKGVEELTVCKTCFMAYAMTHALMNFDHTPFSA